MSFILNEKTLFSFPEKANNEALMEIFGNFTHNMFKNVKFSSEENVIMIGEGEVADIEDAENVINVTGNGIYIKGANYTNLVHGFFLFRSFYRCFLFAFFCVALIRLVLVLNVYRELEGVE